jgi:hypothetical protein
MGFRMNTTHYWLLTKVGENLVVIPSRGEESFLMSK